MPTATTLPLLVLIVVLWRLTRGQVLPIVAFTSIFGAASALNFGVLGVSPWMFSFGVCLAAKLVSQGYRPMRLGLDVNRPALLLFLLFLGWALLSAAICPWIFAGAFVDHGTSSGPLTWHLSNLAQVLYLLAVFAVYVVTLSSSPQERATAVQWYLRGCVAVSLFALYQLVSATLHLPYPKVILDTSPSYVIYPAYKIGGMWRLDATFCEASEMAGFLLPGVAIMGWRLATTRIRLRHAVGFLMMVTALLFTLSSLGYVSLVAMAALGFLLLPLKLLRTRSLPKGHVLLTVFVVGICGVVLACNQDVPRVISRVVNATLLEKTNSSSYRERTGTHATALRTLEETAYVGAGWGSIRASGLGFILLGDLGLPGLLLFALFYLAHWYPLFQRRSLLRNRPLFLPCLFATVILLFSMFVAGSEPVNPILWTLLGVAATEAPRLRRNVAVARTPQPFSGPRVEDWILQDALVYRPQHRGSPPLLQ